MPGVAIDLGVEDLREWSEVRVIVEVRLKLRDKLVVFVAIGNYEHQVVDVDVQRQWCSRRACNARSHSDGVKPWLITQMLEPILSHPRFAGGKALQINKGPTCTGRDIRERNDHPPVAG